MKNNCLGNGCIWTLETKLPNGICSSYATDWRKCHTYSKSYLLLRSLSVLTSEKLTTNEKKLRTAWFKECQFVTQGIAICILIVLFLLSHSLQLEDQSEREIWHHLWQSDSGTKNAGEVSCCLKFFLSQKMYKWKHLSLHESWCCVSFIYDKYVNCCLPSWFVLFLLSQLIFPSFLKSVHNACVYS